jgi:hypothetical protein
MSVMAAAATAGPYSAAQSDPGNLFDAPVEGLPGGAVSPEFLGWASGYLDYLPAVVGASTWMDPTKALGPVTGDQFDIVALGDLNAAAIAAGDSPGEITLTFDVPLRDGLDADFAVFENTFLESGISQAFAELAYVEVSSDGVNFARFESDSLTAAPVSQYGSLNTTNVYNLAGKHVNNNGNAWGTPFDLDDLSDHALVLGGQLDLQAVTHVRVVDVPGSGDFLDGDGDPIYDAWVTMGSGGFDLEAVGVLNQRPDFDLDGDVDDGDLDWLSAIIRAGSSDMQYDFDNDGDVDEDDLAAMAGQAVETAVGVGTALGDANLDGVVNATDLAVMKANFGFSPKGWGAGNANTDEVINATDLAIMATTFGFVAPTGAVPEPTTMLLLTTGLAGLIGRRRRT